MWPLERGTTGVVDLDGHEARRELDDVGLDLELVQGVGRFQTEQTATDDHTGLGGLRRLADRLEVVDRPVDEDVLEVLAGHRRDEGGGTGGEHQDVVRLGLAVAEGDLLRLAVDRGDLGVEEELDPGVVVGPFGQEREGVGADLEERRQGDAVVGRTRLLTGDDDVVPLGEATLDGSLDEAVTDHAVTGDNKGLASAHGGPTFQLGMTVGAGCCHPVSVCFGEETGSSPACNRVSLQA
jgi:hypothetical protein